MRKLCLAPLASLALGFAGAVLRTLQLATTFEPDTGLTIPGNGPGNMLTVLTVVMLLLSAAMTVASAAGYSNPAQYRKAFYTHSYLSFAVSALLGLFVTFATLWLVLGDVPTEELTGHARTVFLFFNALCGIGMVTLAYYAYTQKDGWFLRLGGVLPCIFLCYWMVAQYRVNAGNPTLAEYSFPTSALAFASLSFYYTAGIVYGRKRQSAVVFTGMLAPFLLTVSLVDPYPTALRLIIAAVDVVVTQNTIRFLAALHPKEAQP